jgi:hypothetical protein
MYSNQKFVSFMINTPNSPSTKSGRLLTLIYAKQTLKGDVIQPTEVEYRLQMGI